MSKRNATNFVLGCFVGAALSGSACPSMAAPAPPAMKPSQLRIEVNNPEAAAAGLSAADLKSLAALENTHFQRTFDADSPEKRVKRLELFLNGYGQTGTLSQRTAGLKDFAASRRAVAKPGGLAPTRHNASQSVNQLELSILKKTTPKLDLSTRLSILEKKVFGTAFASIPIEQRIARLQKTIGIGDDDIAEIPQMTPNFQISPGYGAKVFPPGMMFNSPFMSPYGNGLSTDPDINRHMSEMFDHLNQQLRQLHSMPPGTYTFPQTQPPRQYINPDGSMEFSDGLPAIPKDGMIKAKPSLPPYLDPNSI